MSSGKTKTFSFSTIGRIESRSKYRYDAPRQSVFANQAAFLRWTSNVYAECAADLAGFDRVWLVWVFDRNENSKLHTRVRVPVPAEKDKYSVFATRSPYRPNPIGISAVELLAVTPDGLQLGACDLLDGTSVLDVKPYIPEADAFPDAKAGWRDMIDKKPFELIWSDKAAKQADFILAEGNLDIRNFCKIQLSYRPVDSNRKRVETLDEENHFLIRYRTWKIYFELDEEAKQIRLQNIESNYSADDLASDSEDRYMDKDVHRSFIASQK